ncbi:MAG: TaqI-like C-terminal specificity domain-containing protein [Melioribacteraceae bacterium]|nr:MAG: TaqI-like C-terminal specificity domain-containing protein [Melioribacteraceae bacterium]
METKNLLSALIEDFSTENLTNLFRRKTTAYRQLDEEAANHNNDIFSDALLLGEIKLENDDELIIYTFKTNKTLTERSGKKAQYDLAKKILKQEQRYTAGFFIFYDDNNNFRFSLVYDIPQPNGKREWSSFKRFTYYVSKDQTNKTFLYRLDAADFSSLEKIKEAFSVEKVTKEFYTEIANWYFWALKNVKFPKDAEVEKNGKNIALIRFITRIIFIWFMKQKKLVSNTLFDKDEIKKILKSLAGNESTYYKAILQNLFFATLNTPVNERRFRKDRTFQGKNDHYMSHNYYRYHSLFNNPEDMLNIFKDIPFLNGGLFECLDKSKNDPSNDTGEEIRIDGFSDKENNQTNFPNMLFFSDEKEVDLNKDYGTAKKKYKARGLLNILHSYNFTIDENTPTDEEIALDPELLGRVFENLLASYNPETASTARKSTGSYYTPREIVNYMVDESLIAYLKNKVIEGAKSYIEIGTEQSDMFGNSARKGQLKIEEELKPTRWIDNEGKLEDELRKLVSYSEDSISFTDKETDILINAINNCKILDPAVGSGAFPMGVLHKLVLILSKLDPHNTKWKQQQITAIESNVTDPKLKRQLTDKIEENFNRNELDYGRKLYLIQNCLYGVDIQPIAIQISKLRFFISLLVDEKVQHPSSAVDNYGIEPLPNLETKLVAANTLIALPESLTLKPRAIEKLEDELFALRKRYFITSSETEKKTLEKNDREIRAQLKKLLYENGFPSEFAEQISKWDPYNTNIASGWFNPEWMFGPEVEDGFDVVIGNPPYLPLQKMDSNSKKELEKQRYKTFIKTGDIYVIFYERGNNILRHRGILTFITSRQWMHSSYGKKARNYFINYANPLKLIDLGKIKLFEAATVFVNILILQNERFQGSMLGCELKADFDFKNNSITVYFNKNSVSLTNLDDNTWKIGNEVEFNINNKITAIGKPLGEFGINFFRGITSGLNDAFYVGESIKKELIKKDSKNKNIIRPLLRGKDIKRYNYTYQNIYLINTHNGVREFNIPRINVIKDYPSVYDYLKQFKKELEVRQDQGAHWTNLRNCAFLNEFEKEKIVWLEISDKANFAYDSQGMYLTNSAYFLTGKNLKYILAILNSKLSDYHFFQITAKIAGGRKRYTKQYVGQIRIPEISENDQKPFTNLVDKILATKKQNPQANTKHIEDHIDIMVYKLYNLTYEEVEIIDPQIGSIINKEDYDKFEIK